MTWALRIQSKAGVFSAGQLFSFAAAFRPWKEIVMFRRLWRIAAPVVAIASLGVASASRADTLLAAGTPSSPPNVWSDVSGTVKATVSGTYSVLGGIGGIYQESVVQDTLGLDFVYQFKETSASEFVERITTNGYAGFDTYVGYANTLNSGNGPYGAGAVIPTDVGRSASGSVISFDLLLNNGNITKLFVIKTNAKYFTTNNTSFQDGLSANATPNTYGPSAVPLPATANMGLVLLGCLGGLGAIRRMKLKKECELA